MSGLQTAITELSAPYNTIIRTPSSPISNNFTSNLNNALKQDYLSGAVQDIDDKEKLTSDISKPVLSDDKINELIKEIMLTRTDNESKDKNKPVDPEGFSEKSPPNTSQSPNNLLALVNGYLSGKIQNYDNRNDMVTNLPSQSFDPLRQMVKDYLSNNTSMYDNRGKYFDQFLFNQKFDEYIAQKQKERFLKEKVKLNDLNQVENIKIHPYQLPLNKMMIGVKDTWFNMYDNLVNGRKVINVEDESQSDSMFYIGITLIVIALLYLILNNIFE